MASPLSQPVKIACIQLLSGADKAANLARARTKVLEAARLGANIVVLPECFNSPYGTSFFPTYAEEVPALGTPATSVDDAAMPSFAALRDAARDAGVYLVGGSIPERDARSGQLFNTSLVFSPAGALIGMHRKVHLFDISIPGKITFRESDVLAGGSHATVVAMPPYGRVGVAICYDIRFPALAAVAARNGCFAYVVPGAFNMTTGPLHWRLLAQARAVDNQMYTVLCSPARDMTAGYHAWGHSLVVDPMAGVVQEADEQETIVVAELRPEEIENARKGIPVGEQKRWDVYPDVSVGAKVVIS
ncbi:hypothetical protein TD95_003257 [Thielaviopsis punctulata]|uniref:CN hydrolase domain-containing protein n=1 Tax=Thielaviopsis punctulata TaxID=72032 RepID=A0A0F4Z9Q6_9PEZI|nr:hypothetical protein TD95_003257 [Thielaviopsis punctulata]